MIWTLLALLLWVILGGFISYYGDLQGRRWGKRRVSWFGMRPKHTAILITSLTGAFIALMSIATLLLIAPTVRNIILGGERAIDENKQLNTRLIRQRLVFNGDLKETRARLDLMKIQKDSADREYAQACTDLKEEEGRVARMRKINQDLQGTNATFQKQLTAKESTLSRIRATVENLKQVKLHLAQEIQKATRLNDQAELINRQLGIQNVDLYRKNGDLEKKNQNLLAVNGTLTTNNEMLVARNANLTSINSELQQKRDDLERARDGVLHSYNALLNANQEEKDRINAEIDGFKTQLAELEQKRDRLYTEVAGEGHAYIELRQGHLALRAGAELARRTLDAHLRPEAVRRELLALLDDASAVAQMHHAERGENGRAVCIVTKRVVTLTGIEDADEQASLDALVGNLSGWDTPVVVVAHAVNNCVDGEQVLIELTAHSVSHIFDRGAMLATRRIDASQPVERVVNSILQFLQQDVRNAAIKAGTIPQINPDTGATEVGVVGPAELVELTERVRKLGGDVQLTAVVAEPMTSADPLHLTFEVSRPK